METGSHDTHYSMEHTANRKSISRKEYSHNALQLSSCPLTPIDNKAFSEGLSGRRLSWWMNLKRWKWGQIERVRVDKSKMAAFPAGYNEKLRLQPNPLPGKKINQSCDLKSGHWVNQRPHFYGSHVLINAPEMNAEWILLVKIAARLKSAQESVTTQQDEQVNDVLVEDETRRGAQEVTWCMILGDSAQTANDLQWMRAYPSEIIHPLMSRIRPPKAALKWMDRLLLHQQKWLHLSPMLKDGTI